MICKVKIAIISVLFIIHNGLSQDMKVFRDMFREAESILLYLDEEEEALDLFLRLEEMDPGNAHIQYKIGLCLLHIQGEKHNAIPYLERAVLHTSEDYAPTYKERNAPMDAFFYLALSYHVNKRLDEAIEAYNDFIQHTDVSAYYNVEYVREQINGCLLAKEMLKNPLPVKETLLGETINKEPFHLNPVVSGDGLTMVYTIKSLEEYRIFYSTRENGEWMGSGDITEEIDARGDGISSALSFDGKTLFVYRDNRGLGDLFVSYYRDGEWTILERLNRNINTKYWESSCCLSPDGNTLYFSSNRKGGYGRLDIYRSERTPDGDWGPAKNLGPIINSPLMEDNPQLTTDGQLLFFSSQGHSSIGGFDYFYSKRTKRGNWSLPVNLGYPISTTDDDKFMAPIGQGDTVYYAHFEPKKPEKRSIYQLVLRAEEPPPGISLRGTARLQDSNIKLDSTIMVSLVDTVSGETIETVQPDRETGKYEFLVPPGNYQLVYTSPGYETQIHHLSVDGDFSSRDVAVNTRLVPEQITSGNYLFIQNIYFGFDDFSLSREEQLKLEKISAFMHEYPELEFEVIGYTDTVGSKAYNYQLSGRRANTVAIYLFNKGITKERLLTKGVGEIMAVSRDQYQEIQDLDDPRYYRRVEIKILKPDSLMEVREEIELPEYLRPKNALNYSVIVIKVKEKLPEDFFDKYEMEELRYIREQQVSDGYIYTLGSFAQKQRAVGLLGDLRSVGFDKARVVDQHELSDIVVGEDPDPGFFQRPEKITEIPFYTIQIFALKNPPNPGVFRGRDDILAFECLDGFIRYCIGKYQGYSKALIALPDIQEEWYKDAFIQDLSRLEKGLPPGWEEDE